MKMILTALLLVSSTVFAQNKDEAALVKLHETKFEWLINRQYDSLLSLMDDRLMYIHSSGLVETKNDVVENLKAGKLAYTKVDVKESHARIFNETGIVTGKGTFTGTGDGKPFETQLAYTEVYVRTKKQWRLVSRHASRLVP